MNTAKKNVFTCLFALLFLLLQVSPVYAVSVVPAVNQSDGTKLNLTYQDGETGVTYVLKRKAKSATSWTEVAEGVYGTLPATDGDLTAGVEYEYALFDGVGVTQLQTTPFSAIPNKPINVSQGPGFESSYSSSPVYTSPAGETETVDSPAGTQGVNVPDTSGANTSSDNLVDLLNQINAVINAIIPFLVGIAVLVIIWGVFQYISGAGDEEKRGEARKFIMYGVIGVFLMLSIWGFVNVLANSFDLKKTPLPEGSLPNFGGEALPSGR